MGPEDDFQEDEEGIRENPDLLLLSLDGFDGPIDLLLTLARDQKVDLTKISILALAEQYIAFIERAQRLRLEVAADYLVMAAWLAYLKSRLLLPVQHEAEEEEDPAEMAARLAFQLQRLEAMQKAAQALQDRAQLGQDFYKRGQPEKMRVETHNTFDLTLYDLLRTYGRMQDKMVASTLRIMPTDLYSMDEAVERLRTLLGTVPDWKTLADFLPDTMTNPLVRRSMMAAHFVASLELVREGVLEMRQTGIFEPIFLRQSSHPEEGGLQEEEDNPSADNDNKNIFGS